jgi:Tol biopolymer transport system component
MMNDPVGAMTKIASLKDLGGRLVLNPSLSPDGKKVAFQVYGKGMYVCNIDGSALKSIGLGVYPTWLPDNECVVFNRTTDDGSRLTASQLIAMNVNTGKTVTLVANSDIIPLKSTVSPDGKKIAFENVADEAIYVVNLKY